MLPRWLDRIIKSSKKRHVMHVYYISLFSFIFLGYIAFKLNLIFVQYIAGPFIGLYFMLGVYISFVYDIPLFKKYGWSGKDSEQEMGIFDTFVTIFVFFMALYIMFQTKP